MLLQNSRNTVINTETQLVDKCIRIFKRDERSINSYLKTVQNYFGLSAQEINKEHPSIEPTTIESENTQNYTLQNLKENKNGSVQQRNRRRKHNIQSRVRGESQTNLATMRESTENEQNGKQDHRRLSSEGDEVQTKKGFKRPTSIGLPISYSCLDSYMSCSSSDNLPVFANNPSRRDVKSTDKKAFQAYTSTSERLSDNMLHFLCGSTLAAFDVLGLSFQAKGDYPQLKPKSIRASVTELGKNTNSGWEDFGRKNDVKVQKKVIHWLTNYLKRPTFYSIRNQLLKANKTSVGSFSDLSTLPTFIFHRFQISPLTKLSNIFETKIRPVWCVPYSIVSLENMFFGSMIDQMKLKALQEQEPVFPISYSNKQLSERVAIPMHRSLRRSISRKARSFDFSKFDQRIHTFFTSAIFTIWKTNLDLTERRSTAYDALRFYSCYTPFIDEGKILVTRRGVCSGSYTTNSRDTIVNLTLIICALRIKYKNKDIADKILNDILFKLEDIVYDFRYEIRKGTHYTKVNDTVVYGDDGLMIEDDDFFKIHRFICGEIGLVVKYDEPYSPGESFFFLGRFWDDKGLPWQTDHYLKAHIMFRSRWYKKDDLKFNISENLDLYRVLSICLPLKNGKQFLDKYFSEWKPYKDFVNGEKGFYLLKEWPHDMYEYISRDDAFNILRY